MKICVIGGHLSPALATIDALPKQTEIVFVGRKYALEGDTTPSLEYKTVREREIPFIHLETGRLQRRFSKHTLPSLLRLPKGFSEAFRILREQKPDLILGFGGYLSIPLCFAGFVMHIPIIIHEQTLEAGLANKLVAKFATKVCISFENSKKLFPKEKCILTGNPLRKEIIEVKGKKREENTRPVIFVTGGSAGSKAINREVEKLLPDLLKKYAVIHLTGGANELEDYHRLSKIKLDHYIVYPFATPKEYATFLAKSDMVICRSGMNTVTELLALEKPCILIPLPHGQKNEQLKNALFLKQAGIGVVLEQANVTSEKLLRTIETVLSHRSDYVVSDKKLSHIHERATEQILSVINDVTQKKTLSV